MGPLKTPIRFWLRLAVMILWTAFWVPLLYAGVHFKLKSHNWVLRQYCGGMMRIMGVKIKRHGRIERRKPTLYVSNHCSYFDIHGLASVLPGVFLAKEDILTWPVVGWLCTLSGCVFISRDPHKTMENIAKIKNNPSKSFILFPEGTTTDGNRVKKFSSAFFSLVSQLGPDMVVQPISLAYTRVAGIPMGYHYRPYFTWFGDMDLASHVKESLSFSSVTLEITAHPTIEGETLKDRKKLSAICEKLIATSTAEMLTHPVKRGPRNTLLKKLAA